LSRASAVLITRSDASDLAEPIARAIARWNPQAPVFLSTVEPRAWVEHTTGKRIALGELPFRRLGAFCGLGNPAAFRRTLEHLGEHLGLELADFIAFDDHHRYRPRELTHMAQQMAHRGATALVTTQKDDINLCDGAAGLAAPLPIYWLEIGIRIGNEEEFVRTIEQQLVHRQ
jgi:tetraacyldisaccharide 4'-kinase